MVEPWFDPNRFGALYGAIVGGGGGSLAGLLGAFAGTLAPRGKARSLVLGLMVFFIVIGALQLIFGIIALACGQPYGIWYPPLLCGVLFSVLFAVLIPVVRARYRNAQGASNSQMGNPQ